MSKIMPVDLLSSIKGATSSKAVDQLFEVIKNAEIKQDASNKNTYNAVSIEDLRADVVENSSEITKQIIKENFPNQKNGYLVVSKVIEG
ncbi:MAG: hypothetical protein ACN4EF_04950 [Wenyingzhuangia sp.]|jgi:Asp-tRNA(Asn)/Glu-tRNA(Gln) amidotransferase C subunit|uniref:hypothetical protein n=1 Tax=Wenyingzhuangia sp. TaxID=1964193 RepID=UPI00321C3203